MDLLNLILAFLGLALGVGAALHALLRKREPRAALAWVAFCLLVPYLGALLYFLFGINRIQMRASKLLPRQLALDERLQQGTDEIVIDQDEVPQDFSEVVRIGNALSGRPLLYGNRIDMLQNGEEAYPAMLEAIECAQRTVYLTTYIFELGDAGDQFVDALRRCVARGVDVRVLIDGIGEFYGFQWTSRELAKHGIRVAHFMPPRLFPPTLFLNLRNHRKILVTDCNVAFAGGMNIRDCHMADDPDNDDRVIDTQFRFTGPVVAELEAVFLEDWSLVTGESVERSPLPPAVGRTVCRAVVDGPNETLDKLSTLLIGAVSAASHRVWIMTPYFLPPPSLIAALQAAALRGVDVAVILPEKNNLAFVHWATRNMLWELLQRGVRVFYQPPPFVHTKLFLVDDYYAQVGSANLDPRSLNLNFELAVEVYDRDFGGVLAEHFRAVRNRSHQTSLEEMDGRSLPAKIRDATAWLFTPYL